MNLANILVTPLRRIETAGGDVLHALQKTEKSYAGFGEVYFSWVLFGATKAWKRHNRMTMNLVVPVGRVKFVFCSTDEAGVSKFRIEEIGEHRYARITVPPGIWFGFQGLEETKSLVLNIANIAHDPNEVERLALTDIKYIWS
ncbi:dTDP-4-dehydrorhamnose 3,5-epimerase [Polynucleobacter paneuropaeus]|nr:dTDP-4-dehydrorhamnose 3,5-epimerase [Polynucleobacter paneuropaeus]